MIRLTRQPDELAYNKRFTQRVIHVSITIALILCECVYIPILGAIVCALSGFVICNALYTGYIDYIERQWTTNVRDNSQR